MSEVETKDLRLVVRADRAFLEKIKAAAKKDNMPLSVWVRHKLHSFIK